MLDLQNIANENIVVTNYGMIALKSSVPLYLGVQFGKKRPIPPRRTVVFTRSEKGVVELDRLTRAPHEPDYLAFSWKYHNSSSPVNMGQIRYHLMDLGFNPVIVHKLFPAGSKSCSNDEPWIRRMQKKRPGKYSHCKVVAMGRSELHLGIGICPEGFRNRLVLLTKVTYDMTVIDWLSFTKRAAAGKQFRWLWFGNDHDNLRDFSRTRVKKQLRTMGFDPRIVDSTHPKVRRYMKVRKT